MMLPDVIGHENQSQHYQHRQCLCLDLSGRITTPDRFSYHTGTETDKTTKDLTLYATVVKVCLPSAFGMSLTNLEDSHYIRSLTNSYLIKKFQYRVSLAVLSLLWCTYLGNWVELKIVGPRPNA